MYGLSDKYISTLRATHGDLLIELFEYHATQDKIESGLLSTAHARKINHVKAADLLHDLVFQSKE